MHILIYLLIALALVAIGYLGHKAISAYLDKVHAKVVADKEALKQAAEAELQKSATAFTAACDDIKKHL